MKAIPGTVSEYVPEELKPRRKPSIKRLLKLAEIIREAHTPITHEQNVVAIARRVVCYWNADGGTPTELAAALDELAAALKAIDKPTESAHTGNKTTES